MGGKLGMPSGATLASRSASSAVAKVRAANVVGTDTQADPSRPRLDVCGVTIQYKTQAHLITATYRVDFSVLQGDRFVLLGPSGCGKSTLVRAVGGRLDTTSG